jgi:hypothetical protein
MDFRTTVSFVEDDVKYTLDATFNCIRHTASRNNPEECLSEVVDIHSFKAVRLDNNERVEIDEPTEDQMYRFEDLAFEKFEFNDIDESDYDVELDDIDLMTREDFFLYEDSTPELISIF